MPARVSIAVEQSTSATPVSVYGALMDLDRWPEFMPGISAASWEVSGEPDTAVGGIRRMRIGRGVTRDRILAGTKPHHHAYAAELPWYQAMLIKDYRGDIRIEDRPDGSLIIWTASCTPRLPGIRNLSHTLRQSYSELAAALVEEAERRSAQ
ncbi:SRPBCC family protein [Mycobacterium barrassiae]|uniref:SRPBCC family protein n=1 Tax=Mycobacterium barrassiae TaxID=319709 RepID=UPI0035576109|nr:SRPBCC family protein [Mycobacterium barrassiae]